MFLSMYFQSSGNFTRTTKSYLKMYEKLTCIFYYTMNRLEKHDQALTQGITIYDYIIIGAGTSGMQIAEILTKKTKNILILEAQDTEGGRIYSESIVDLEHAKNCAWIMDNKQKYKDSLIERGATWIEERHELMLRLCKDFGLTIRQQISKGNNYYLNSEKTYTSQELMKHPTIGPALKMFIQKIDYLAKLYNQKVLMGGDTKMLIDFDRKYVMEFLQQNIEDPKAREMVQNFLEHTQCLSCEENSMHQVLSKHARSNDVGILKQFLGDYEHEPSFLIDGGTSALIDKFIERIEKNIGHQIQDITKYNHQVITVDNKRPDFCTIISCNTKDNTIVHHKGKKIICTVPLAVTRTISFSNISRAKRYIFDNQLRTTASKSFLIFRKPFWRKFASGDGLFSYDYLVNMCHDISPIDESCGILVFFHNGKKYMEWESKFRGEVNDGYDLRREYLLDVTCKLFGLTMESPECKEYIVDAVYEESTFMNNPYIRSGFQSNTRPGTFRNIVRLKDNLESYYRDENNVYFVGSEYSKQFASYMEGAIRVARLKGYQLIGEKDPYAL